MTLARMWRGPRLQLASLTYHEIGDDPTTTGFQRPGARRYRMSTRAFAAHLDAIAEAALPMLVTMVDFTRVSRNVLLTFDDGGKSARYTADALAARGWHGHFFIVTSLLGGRTFLDATDVRAIHDAGHVIGSHSHTHPDIFKDLTPAQLIEEWRVSRDRLAQILGAAPVAASVPGGDISPDVMRSADAAGFRYLFTSEPWLMPCRVGDCHVLGRYTVTGGTQAATIGALVRARGWGWALLVRRMKGLLRAAFPQWYRQYVRHTTSPESVT